MDSLRNMLVKLLDSPNMVDNKRSQGATRVKIQYDWNTITVDTERLYEKALALKGFFFSRKEKLI